MEIEQSADALRTWQPLIIPGLLQTVDYARALLGGKPGVSPGRVEASLAARIDRQHILDREDPPMLWVILDEGVLTRPVGAAVWHKSSLSGDNGGDCVEVAELSGGRRGVRDSKNPTGPALVFTPTQWTTFTNGVKNGQFG
ncbi:MULTISPECIES: DUF397 domain-containing protein [unclassified Streptosporangium]|uniref:DUF397 domain-containing protein n=1 Tax=unclassified Streptosporangium TaxID=2632669 RepID=UPI002E2C43C3|nr:MULTISPECIES: DUF397 domain-containing protein [unclassified Streptosporangium]